METIEVKRGQIWADCDSRSEGRTLRVDDVGNLTAMCTVLTNSDQVQAALDGAARTPWGSHPTDMRGKVTRISLKRFRPTSTGYRLITDTPEEG